MKKIALICLTSSLLFASGCGIVAGDSALDLQTRTEIVEKERQAYAKATSTTETSIALAPKRAVAVNNKSYVYTLPYAVGTTHIVGQGEKSVLTHFGWIDRKSTRLNSSHLKLSRMPSSA